MSRINLSIVLIGGIWALIISIYSILSRWYFFNYFNYSYLIISGGSIVGTIVYLRYNEKTGNLICLWSCIGFIVFQMIISWGYFLLYWVFIYNDGNFAPLVLTLIGSVFIYIDSRKLEKNLDIRKQRKKILDKGSILILIGGILSWQMILNIYPIYYYTKPVASSYLILTWGGIIGVGVNLLYNKKIGSIISIGSGILYILYSAFITRGIFFLYIIEPLSYNLTPFLLLLIGGIISYLELHEDQKGSEIQ